MRITRTRRRAEKRNTFLMTLQEQIRRRLSGIGAVTAGAFMLAGGGHAYALPQGGEVAAGAAEIARNAAEMAITQATQNAVINWNSFNIGAGERVNILQPNAQAALLNRVLGGNPSEIFGTLQANGRVFLVNPAGVLFAPGAHVDVGSLAASTMNITNADFMAGRYAFLGTSDGKVINRGSLIARNEGTIALLGQDVRNEGVIVARKGTVALAAGEAVTLDFNGDGKVGVIPGKAALAQVVENKGLVEADGGLVFMSATAGDALTSSVVNQDGIVRAGSVDGKAGTIRITAGEVRLGAGSRTDASGEQGGHIEIGGGWQGSGDLAHARNVKIAQGAEIHADAQADGGAGGTVAVWSDGRTDFRGSITARGKGTGAGGKIETSGHSVYITGAVNASSERGKAGEWLIDPADVVVRNLTGSETETDSLVSAARISSTLSAGTSTTVQTASGNNDYNLTVSDNITKSGGGDATLTLKATGNIAVNADITSAAGKLNLDITSDTNNRSGGGISIASGKNIATRGGDIKMRGGLVENGVGFANSQSGAGVDLTGAAINTQGGAVEMAGSTTTANPGVKLAGTQIQAGTGKVTIVGKSQSGTGAVIDSGSSITTRTVELRTDSLDLQGTITGDADPAGFAKVRTLTDGKTINFGAGTGGLDLAGNIFSSAGKITNFYKNIVGDANQNANITANVVTADHDLALYSGAGTLTVGGAVNVAAGHALTLGAKNAIAGAGVLTADALVLDAADATVNLTGTHQLGKLDGKAKGLALKNGTNLTVGADTGLVTTAGGASLDVTGNLTVGAHGMTNGAGALSLKASGALTVDPNAEVKSTGTAATALTAASVSFGTASKVSTAGGTIHVTTDALTLPMGAQGTLSSANGAVTVETRTAGKTMSVGAAAADVHMSDFGFINSGTGEVHLGNANTGNIEIGAADVKAPLTVESGATVTFTGALTNANGKNTTFRASAVDFGAGANLAAGAGTMTLNTDTITNWNNVTFADTTGKGTLAIKPKTAGNFTVGGTSALVSDAGFGRIKAGNFYNVAIGDKTNAGTATIDAISSGNLPSYTSILTNGALSVTGAVHGAAADTLALHGDGLTETAPIEVGNLLLLGKGTMDLSAQPNKIGNIAADMATGALKLKNQTDMKVAVVENRTVTPKANVEGLKTKSTNIKLDQGKKLTVASNLNAADDAQIEADDMDLGSKVNVGKTLTLEKADKTQIINVGTGANDWNIDNTNYGKIKIGGSTQTGNINIKGATFKKPSDIETQGSVKLTGATKAGADGKSDMKIKAHDAELPTVSDTLAVKNLDLDLSGGIDLGQGKVKGQKDGKVTARGAAASQDIYIKDDASGVPSSDYRISYRSINDTLDGFGGFDVAGEKHVYFYGGKVKKSMNAAGKLGVEVRDNVTIEGEGTKLTVGSDPSATPPNLETIITGGFTVKNGKSVSVKGKGAAIDINTDGDITLENNAKLLVEGDKADFRLKSRSHDVVLGDDAAVKVLSGTEVHGDVTGVTLNLGARAVLNTGADTVGALRVHVDNIVTPSADDGVTNIEGKSGLVITTRTSGRGMVVDNSTAATPGKLHVTGDQLNGKLFGNQFVALTLGNGQTGDVTIDGVNVDNHVAIGTGSGNKVTIGTGGLTVAANRRVTLRTGSVENLGGAGTMSVGAGGTLTLNTNSIANLAANGSNPSVTGTGTLGIGTYDGSKTIGLGNAATGDLLLPDAKFGSVFGQGFTHYSIGDGAQGTINVNGSTLGKDVTLQADNINFAGDLTLAAGKTLTVNAKTAAQQTAGKIKAANLAALGGNITLDKANEIGTLAADALSVNVKSNALTVGAVTIPAGSPTAQTARTLKGVKAGESGGTAGDIQLSADAMTFNEAVEGKGNLIIQQATDATNLNVGTTGTGLNLPANLFGGNKIKDGFKHVYLGSETATGATKVGGNLNFVDPTTIRSGKTSGTMTLDGTAKIGTNGNAFALESKDLTTNPGSEVNTGTGDLTLKTDKMDLKGKMKGVKALNILPLSHTQNISLGANDPTKLSLINDYFNGNNRVFWDYEIVNIGDKGGGGRLYQSGTIDMPFTVNIQQAITSGSGGVDITGTINTKGKDYTIGSREVNLDNANISADDPNGVNHGNVSIQADRLTNNNSHISGHGDVSFDTYTPGQTISFGDGGGGTGLSLPSNIFSGSGLLQKNTDGKGFRKIRIGGERAGDISVGNVDLPNGLADTLAIKTGGSVTSTGILKSVPTLEVDAHSVNLTGANEIKNLGNITSATGVAVETKGGTTVTGTVTGTNAPIKITNKNGGNVSIAPGGKIVGTGTSDIRIEAQGGAFKNKGGANAIQTVPGQRYVVHTEDSVENEIDGLVFEFRRYGTPYGTAVPSTVPAGKNVMYYAYQPKITLYSSRVYGDENPAWFSDTSGYRIVDDGNLKRRELDHTEIQKIYDKRADSGTHAFGAGLGASTNVNADINTETGEVTQADTDTTRRAGTRTYGSEATNPNENINFTGPNDLNYKVTVDYRIVPRKVTVTGKTETVDYNGTAHSYTGYNGVTFSNFVTGQSEATPGLISGSISYTPIADTSKTSGYAQGALHAGEYTVDVKNSNLSASNYTFVYKPGKLTVKPRDIHFTAPSGERIYGAGNDTITMGSSTHTGTLAAGDSFTRYTVEAEDGAHNAVTERSNVGTYAMTLKGVGLAAGSTGYGSDYHITSDPGTLTIKKRNLTITAGDKSRVYGDANTTARYVNNRRKVNVAAATATTGLVNGDAIDDVTETVDSTATVTANAGTTGIRTHAGGAHFSSGTDANYNITYVDGHFNIEKRALTLVAGDKSRIYGTANATAGYVNGTNLFRVKAGTNLVNGDTISTVTETIDSRAPQTTDAGTQGLKTKITSAVFGTGNANNYDISYEDGSFAITPRALTLRAGDKTRIYGNANDTATYTGGTTKFRADAATATTGLVSGDTVADVTESATATVRTNVGTAGLRTQIADARFGTGKASNYNITYVDGGFTITPRDLTIRAGNKERVYGDANSTAHYVDGTKRINVDAATIATGLVNGDTIGSVTETIDPAATVTTDAGTPGLWTRVSGATFSEGLASNYNIHYADGNFRIVKRPVTVTGVTLSRVYDGTAQHFAGYGGVTFDGFVNGQSETTAGVISGGNIVYQTIANAGDTAGYAQGAVHAGTYDVGLAGSNLTATNYTFTYAPGKLTVTPRALALRAGDKTRVYGNANDTAVYTGGTQKFRDISTGANAGLVGTDTVGDVTETMDGDVRTNAGTPGLKTHIGAAQFSHGKASDYAVTYTDGTLTITPRALTLRAGNKERAYGAENGTAVYTDGTQLFRADDMTATTGLVNGDAVGTVTETIDPNAGLSADAGTPGLWTRIGGAQFARGTASNYTITYVDGGFRIVPRVVRIAVGNVTRYMGEPNPAAPYTIERGTSVTHTGLLPGDEITGITPVYAPSITPNTTFGTYEGVITVTPGAWTYTGGTTPNMANYRFDYTAGNLTIRPRGFDSSTPDGRAVTSGTAVNTPRSAADGGTSSAGGNAPGVRVPESRVTVEDSTSTVTVPSSELQNRVGSWENRVVSGGKTPEVHEMITGVDGSFGYDLARDRGRIGIPDERIPGGTAEAVPVLFTDGGTRDLDGIYAIDYNPNKLSIQPSSKKVDIPDPSEIRSDSSQPMQFLYRNQGGDFKVLFGNGIVTLSPQNDKALSIVKDKDKAAERAVLASGLLTAVEDLGVTPVEIRAVYIFNVMSDESET